MGYSSEQRPGGRCADSQGDHSRMEGKPASLGESVRNHKGAYRALMLSKQEREWSSAHFITPCSLVSASGVISCVLYG